MKIRVERASDWEENNIIEINTLEELMAFIDNEGYSLVIEPTDRGASDFDTSAIIYDDYLE